MSKVCLAHTKQQYMTIDDFTLGEIHFGTADIIILCISVHCTVP